MQKKFMNSVQIFYPKYNREKIIEIIKERVNELKKEMDLVKVVLFGSYAKNRYTVASDIDLLVIYEEKKKDVYAMVKKIIDLPMLEPHVYSKEEYEKIEAIKNMEKDGIIIYEKK